MRINVYAEELVDRTEVVTKDVVDRARFYAVRMYLASPDQLHNDPDDDDSSAITIWVPWTRAGGHDFATVRTVLAGLLTRLDEAQAQAS